MPSKSWSISAEPKRSVPRKSRCSRKCESPDSRSLSPREPVATKKPRAADRTEPMCSVATRSPLGSSVIRCAGSELVPLGVPIAARAPVPIAVAPAAAAPAVAVTVAPTATAVPAATAAAAADRGQLLDGLAGDLGILGEAQADAAALAVDLDHADGDLVALVEDVLDVLDALAGRDVADVQQAVGALRQLDEGAERGRLDDLRGRELVADLDVLEHLRDVLGELLAELAVGRVDQDLTLVVDVDLRLELVGEATDGLPALA